MAAMLTSLIFRLTICISYVFHFYYHVYSFVDFNQSSFQKKTKFIRYSDTFERFLKRGKIHINTNIVTFIVIHMYRD